MNAIRRLRSVLYLIGTVLILPVSLFGQHVDPSSYQGMRWRMIGPFRGGRTVAAVGVPGHPGVFYIGVCNGGVWKTDDYGRTWNPLFDDQPTGSIGAIAVAPSNPEIVYVGSGEGLQRPDLSTGDGIYKSTDGGHHWRHLGLEDGQQIGAVLVDPHNADRVFVAVLGHPYAQNTERGVYRSTDGGEHWDKVLYKDENTGAEALAFDPRDSRTIYAVLWSSRQGPWENGQWEGPGSGLYQSTDGGSTWRQLERGLPTFEQGLGRIGIAVAPSDPNRLYAIVEAKPKFGGVYRSDDAGITWQLVNSEERVWGRGFDFAEVKVDPKDRDTIYIANTSTYKSTDGGKSFVAWKGAPGGDDYHTLWIDPDNPRIILLASDQGAVVTVNDGRTWSSWYNQPTAQFYHVITDNQFPYWVYGGQQESGSVGTASRSNDGEITFREWHPVGAEEYAYIAPDPLNPNIIYGGKVERYDRITGQVKNVAPEAIRSGKYRFLRTQPLLFSPVDPHALYLAGNVLFRTTDGGHSWQVISPDLSRPSPDVPPTVGAFRTPDMAKMQRRGVIYSLGPSYVDANLIWAGTDDGLIHVTRDGGKIWTDVTPPAITAWSKVAMIDAGHWDKDTAYAAVNRLRLDDLRPHVYRTHDGGETWQEIVDGLPPDAPVNTVREDPVRKGLLFAGTETAVYFSADAGDHWAPLRLNMPATSIRDLAVHGDDLVAGTHGRSFWILDDLTPLRQLGDLGQGAKPFIFDPAVAYRLKRDTNPDTPLPPEEPAGKNPPDGALLDYYIPAPGASNVLLDIYDAGGQLVRRFSSDDKTEPVNPNRLVLPMYWVRPPRILSAAPGMHRFVWDLHYPAPTDVEPNYPISAIVHDTPPEPSGPSVLPGKYTIKLVVDGDAQSRTLTVKEDPRVSAGEDALRQQFDLSMKCYEGLHRVSEMIDESKRVTAALKAAEASAQGDSKARIADARKKLSDILGETGAAEVDIVYTAVVQPQEGKETVGAVQTALVYLLEVLQSADDQPTEATEAGVDEAGAELRRVGKRWREFINQDLKALGINR